MASRQLALADDLQRTVVIAVSVVRMVQVTVDEVVDVVTVRHRLVAAVRSVDVVGRVGTAGVVGRAGPRVGVADGDDVLVHMVLVRVMQMTVVEEVDVAVVADCGVAAALAVDMVVVVMDVMVAHDQSASDGMDSAACSKALRMSSTT